MLINLIIKKLIILMDFPRGNSYALCVMYRRREIAPMQHESFDEVLYFKTALFEN